MKYKIYTIMITVFFLLMIVGLAIANYQEDLSDESITKSLEKESPELPTIMRMLLADIHLINEGIYIQNYILIEQGASKINDHPPLSADTRRLLKETLGGHMDAFGSFDRTVHSRADSLKKAAQDKDMDRVLGQYSIIQQGCVNCHTAFQKEIRMARQNR